MSEGRPIFSGAPIDRGARLRRDPVALEALRDHPDSRFLPIWRLQVLARAHGAEFDLAPLPRSAVETLLAVAENLIFLGLDDGIACFALDLPDGESESGPDLSAQGVWSDLRQIGGLLPQKDGALLAYARGVIHWHRTHRFCGHCGAATQSDQGGHLRRCTHEACAREHYPRTDPAVIMLVTSGDHCLLGRQAAWTPGMYSTLAGFIEPGETPEEAVAREVMEEAGIEIGAVRYHSSQPWPFPGSLMIGFIAEARRRSEPVIDRLELDHAAWFSREDLDRFDQTGRSLSRPVSIARRLIESWRNGA